jgi:hypothetical protein
MALLGLLYMFLLFICCFAFVHILKLAFVGFKALRKPKAKVEPKPEKKVQPVYYIVEKKRAKRSYSEPKEIEFK